MSSSAKLGILLDSTYILPVVGIEVEGTEKALEVLRRLKRNKAARFYYTLFNVLEIVGKLAKLEYDPLTVTIGLSLVEEEFTITHPTINGYLKAIELKKKGFKDVIDLLLYATALTRGLLFLTRDTILMDFLENSGEKTENILLEKDFIQKYSMGSGENRLNSRDKQKIA